MPTLPTPFQHSPGIPVRKIRQEEEIKGIQIGKEIVKVSLFTDDLNLHFGDPKPITPKLLDTINSFSNVAEYKNQVINSVAFYAPTMNRLRKNIGKPSHFSIASKTFKYLGINLTKYVNDLYKENYKSLKKEIERSRKTIEGGKVSHVHRLAKAIL
jgi:hypothetical protein